MSTNDLVAFIEARLAEDEWWARNAGVGYDHVPPATGEHWQWVETEHDEVVTLDPAAGEHAHDSLPGDDGYQLSLRSVEHYQGGGYDLPTFLIHSAEEVNTVAAGHIARHDPSRVLRDVAAKRRILTEVYAKAAAREYGGGWDDAAMAMWDVLCLLALPYADHPDFRPEWSPTDA